MRRIAILVFFFNLLFYSNIAYASFSTEVKSSGTFNASFSLSQKISELDTIDTTFIEGTVQPFLEITKPDLSSFINRSKCKSFGVQRDKDGSLWTIPYYFAPWDSTDPSYLNLNWPFNLEYVVTISEYSNKYADETKALWGIRTRLILDLNSKIYDGLDTSQLTPNQSRKAFLIKYTNNFDKLRSEIISHNLNDFYNVSSSGISLKSKDDGLPVNMSFELQPNKSYFVNSNFFFNYSCLEDGDNKLVEQEAKFGMQEERILKVAPKPSQKVLLPKSSKKITIKCSKGTTIKKVSGINPKCPKGYKITN